MSLRSSRMHPPSRERVLLLGCVKRKVDRRAAAADLYASPLWRGRRSYAESSGSRWFVLSALHGLVGPDEQLEPYDLALSDLPAAERRSWGERVVGDLERRLGAVGGRTFEFHAGATYVRAVAPLLERSGAVVSVPLAGVPLGRQLGWYRDHASAVGASR